MGEKTEAPTARHLAEMRRKGETAQSPELTTALTLLLAVYLLGSRMPQLIDQLAEVMRRSFASLSRSDLTATSLHTGATSILNTVGPSWLSIFLIVAGAGLAVGLTQTRGLVAPNRLKPSFERINPLSGLKRICSAQGLFETFKGLVKMAILGLLLYGAIQDVPLKLVGASQTHLGGGLSLVGETLLSMARQAALLLVLAAGLDFAWRLRKHRQQMRMSREELMEEMKSNEGQPFIKAKIRSLQRRLSRQRMMQQLVRADVVVTNPTHLAIALQYDNRTMTAPRVIAKGKGVIAEQIVRRCREMKIPIVQNISLAHALIHVEVDSEVPVALYQAVAEVLAFVYRLRKRSPTAAYRGVA